MATAMLFWACSSESYPGLEYENPNSVINEETPNDSVGLPIHVYVNEQSAFSLSAQPGLSRDYDITRGVGAFQIEEDEDIQKNPLTPEEDTLMQLKKDTTTFYIYAFRDRKAKQTSIDDPDTERLRNNPNLHDWYQKAAGPTIPTEIKGQDAQRLDCLIDGFDYYKGMPSNVDDKQVLKMHLPETAPMYWSEYQGVSYNFFAYTVGDINKNPNARLNSGIANVEETEHIQWGIPHRDADSIWYENFAIDGSQDIMTGYAPLITSELLDSRYKHIELTEGERNRILNDGNYTSFAAHRNIEPQIDMKHLLTRLRFRMLPGDSTSTYTTIDTVFVTTPYKGNLVVAVNNYEHLDQIGFKPDPNNYADLYLYERPKFIRDGNGKAVGLEPSVILGVDSEEPRSVPWTSDYWIRNSAGEIIGKKPLSDRGAPVRLGDAMMIPEAEEIILSIKSTYKKEERRFRSRYVISAKDQCGEDITNTKYYDPTTGTFKFKRGYIYDITLVVYGLQEIQVAANIEVWKDGGEIFVDPDDAVDEDYY